MKGLFFGCCSLSHADRLTISCSSTALNSKSKTEINVRIIKMAIINRKSIHLKLTLLNRIIEHYLM